jgi:hypothetical protein
MTDKIDSDDTTASRRDLLKGAAGAGAGALTITLLPQWIKPVAEFVATPANAAEGFYLADIFRRSHTATGSSSDSEDGTAEGDETPEVSTTTSTSTTSEGTSTSTTSEGTTTSTTSEGTTTSSTLPPETTPPFTPTTPMPEPTSTLPG